MKSSTIWTQCGQKSNLKKLTDTPCRVVEDQYRSSTRKLIDSVDEQRVIEEDIDKAKPRLLSSPHLHFLLSTPFRYPPLKYGSRFGDILHKGIWYGSLGERTALAERAYYLFRIFQETKAPMALELEFTMFWTEIRSERAVDLTHKNFAEFWEEISAKDSYVKSQQLGEEMRLAGVAYFRFNSARDKEGGINIGIFSDKVFASHLVQESDRQDWDCYATAEKIEFRRRSFTLDDRYTFLLTDFLVKGKLPIPKTD